MATTVIFKILLILLFILLCVYNMYGKPVPRSNGKPVPRSKARVSVSNDLDSKSLGFLFSKGYLKASSPWVGDLSGPAKVQRALKIFQKFVGIPETGVFDEVTAEYMAKPRCGMPDILDGNLRKKRFLIQGTKWENGLNKRLTWALENHNNDGLSDFKVRRILKKSFAKWAQVANVKFIELVNQPINTAIIRVRFAQNKHGDPYAFDGIDNTLAHAFFPLNNTGLSGDVHFDDAEVFTDDPNAGRDKRKLLWIAVHEIGHSIGLRHSDVKGSIMFPIYNHFEGSDFVLTHDDIAGAQTIYGPNFNIGPPPRPTKFSGKPRTTVSTTTEAPRTPPPVLCTDVMKAAYVGYTGNVYVINNDKFYVLSRTQDGVDKGPLPVNTIFNEITKVDTVFRRSDRFLVLFHDDKFTVYNDQFILRRRPRLINDGFQNIKVKLKDVDAAFIWPENKKLYIFKGQYYWRLSQLSNLDYIADYGYPQIIYYRWKGLPKTIDTAFQWTNGVMYFTKDKHYYRWDKRKGRVASGYPIKLSRGFLNCQGDETVRR